MRKRKATVALGLNVNNEIVNVVFPAEMLRNWIYNLKLQPGQETV